MSRARVDSKARRALERLVRPTRPTIAEIARRLGVTPQAVSAWVSGISTPSEEMQARLLEEFGVPRRWEPIRGSEAA